MKKITFFDNLRLVGCVAVVLIHSIGPYREQIGKIPDYEWAMAIGLNGSLRWAVPVFIMITGALMLSDTRKFDLNYFIKRRVFKVFIPFLVWSLFFTVLSGLTSAGFEYDIFLSTLKNLYHHEAYYHLGFFYYFIPLYFIIPFLRYMVQTNTENNSVEFIILIWLVLTLMYLLSIQGFWTNDLFMYGGFLLLGYYLYLNKNLNILFFCLLGLVSLIISNYFVLKDSFISQTYDIGLWFSYKTLNTVLIATMIFLIVCQLSGYISIKLQKKLSLIGKYSLGIYLIHPLFLWPTRNYDIYIGPTIFNILLWGIISFTLSFVTVHFLSKLQMTRWLVP